MPAASPIEFLCEEQDALKTLLCRLHDEQVVLSGAAVDDLFDLTTQKAAIVTRMVELASARHRSLAAEGFASDEVGMRAWLDKHRVPSLVQVWTETLLLVQSAKELNRVNGVLIAKRLSRTQQTLSLLRAEPVPGMIYGADGQPKVVPTMRGLVVS
jgi:flagellar biosynthesis protein FlgN